MELGIRTAYAKKMYTRVGRLYSPGEVSPWIGDVELYWGGKVVKMNSQRYKLWQGAPKKRKCVCCGVEGKYYALEKNDVRTHKFHFNLYGVNKEGYEVLMTKDHIIPKSKGGPNDISNYQTMCTKCNSKKGNRMIFTGGKAPETKIVDEAVFGDLTTEFYKRLTSEIDKCKKKIELNKNGYQVETMRQRIQGLSKAKRLFKSSKNVLKF